MSISLVSVRSDYVGLRDPCYRSAKALTAQVIVLRKSPLQRHHPQVKRLTHSRKTLKSPTQPFAFPHLQAQLIACSYQRRNG
jgi:hypothetical protein